MTDEPGVTTDQTTTEDDQEVVEDVLVEEVSIDGMCGVY
jgi:mycofactocin precursor